MIGSGGSTKQCVAGQACVVVDGQASCAGSGSSAAPSTKPKEAVSIRVRVDPNRPVRAQIGSTIITGAAGSFTSTGKMVVATGSAALRPADALRVAGEGVRISFEGTRLRKALTVSYRVGKRPAGFEPRVAHLGDDGSWDLRKARLSSAHRLVVKTKEFSFNIPTWLDPKQWLSDVQQWAADAGNWVASGLGGRTAPLTNCGAPAPSWFSYDKASDMVHVCSIDNDGRAEIQLKSNRGITVEVHVPGNPAYVWVEDQPWWLRSVLNWNPNQLVLLGPGQRMTVGYDRPSDAFSGNFDIADDTWRAFLDDALRAMINQIAGDSLSAGWLVTYAWGQCATGAQASLTGKWVDSPGVVSFVGCMFKSLTALVNHPEDALRLAEQAGGDQASASQLVERAKALTVAGKVLNLYPLIQATAIHDVDDSLRALLKGGNDTVTISIAGSGVTSSPGATGSSGSGQSGPPVSAQLAPPPAEPCSGAGGTSSGGPGVRGFHIDDAFYLGTWGRNDPCDGTWHTSSDRPANGAYWYKNGLGVGVDCARDAAPYVVRFADGRSETWRTWLHVTDGEWFPSAAAQEISTDGLQGLPTC